MKSALLGCVAASVLALTSCQSAPDKTAAVAATPAPVADAVPVTPAGPTPADATKFLAEAEEALKAFGQFASRTAWIQQTYINDDSNWLQSRARAQGTEMAVRYANATKAFQGLELSPTDAAKMQTLRTGITLPAPSAAGAAAELAEITTRLSSAYATGKFEINGRALNLDELSTIIETSRRPAELRQVWEGWRTVSPQMKDDYARMVEIANSGARELGFDNVADMWLSNYDMPPREMEAEVERLWTQVEPLYKQLHCHVRAGLNTRYGDAVQPRTGPIRADLLGNMWAQQWDTLYPIVGPKTSDKGYDLTRALQRKGYDAVKMVRTGEGFYSSLGFAPLPETFWKRSQIVRPADREVQCHASAWNVDDVDDIRIKMCTEVNAEDFVTVHHELGHNYYQRAYNKQDYLLRDGAHDGFHEAIGDFVALSITPEYLKEIGLIDKVPPASADIGLLMDRALEKVAFLPFSVKVDKWRWQVFRGETRPAAYNDAWWALSLQYQGIAPPGPRPADAFDPGAKNHIPGNTPYLRYFLAHVLQFQFHEAACRQAGWTGPLHRCSIYGNKEVGARLNAMLEMGAAKPWPDALEAFTGARRMDATPMLTYFAPLSTWLEEQNKGRTCGW